MYHFATHVSFCYTQNKTGELETRALFVSNSPFRKSCTNFPFASSLPGASSRPGNLCSALPISSLFQRDGLYCKKQCLFSRSFSSAGPDSLTSSRFRPRCLFDSDICKCKHRAKTNQLTRTSTLVSPGAHWRSRWWATYHRYFFCKSRVTEDSASTR